MPRLFHIHHSALLAAILVLSEGQSLSRPDLCLSTFDNPLTAGDPSLYPRTSIFVCPSSCFTPDYLNDRNRFPLYGFQNYSGNSLICKSALHDSRLFPWSETNSSVTIRNFSRQANLFVASLQNGILSTEYSSRQIALNTYEFVSDRVNESRLEDIAIEHRGYLYEQDQPSTILCRSRNAIQRIDPIEIDQQWKIYVENSMKMFTYPLEMNRSEAMDFCQSNNGTFVYWTSADEENQLRNFLYYTVESLFRYQIQRQGPVLSLFIGLQSNNSLLQWLSNVVPNVSHVQVDLTNFNSNDFCTRLESSRTTSNLWRILPFRCNDTAVRAYPLCRLTPSKEREIRPFIYRIETTDSPGNLTGVIDFCSELGGYPVYANNAYEWQLIQEIMLNDTDFNDDYVYTGLISQNKSENNAFWMPRNTSYNSVQGYIRFFSNRGLDRTGFHLSKARNEPFYYLQDIDPYSTLNRLRFCRKDPLASISQSNRNPCPTNPCRSQCLQTELADQSDDLRYSLYACLPERSLYSIVYTHAVPKNGDLLPSSSSRSRNLSVSIRDRSAQPLTFTFLQVDRDLRLGCQAYLDMDYDPSLSSLSLSTLNLNCDRANGTVKEMSLASLPANFNTMLALALDNRRMSGFHLRFIDSPSQSSECSDQGVLHPLVRRCICAPGFYGDQCQFSCPRGYYGQECDYRCVPSSPTESDEAVCRSSLICLPDPYGCSCYSGWFGPFCNATCPSDRYGPDCLYQCSCPSCNRFSGLCNCNGTDCYRGSISRSEIDGRCSLRSTNLVLLIVLPIVCVLVLLLLIVGLLVWRKKQQKKKSNRAGLVRKDPSLRSADSPSPSANSPTIRSNSYSNEFFVLSERL